MKNTDGLRYIAYIRKSEERKERQELSHDAQKRKIREQFPGLNIVAWMEPESKSAFKPGRPIFNQMIKMIREHKAEGIVVYHPNRLSRNEVDAGEVTYMLRTKHLKNLKFCAYTFENTPEGVMMLQIIMSQSQYESSKQGRDVKRGMEQKALGGERPGVVPIGYMKVPVQDAAGNFVKKKDKIATETKPDPERIDLVKKMWKMLLSGVYTTPEIRRIANEEWKFTLRQTAKTGGGSIGLSSMYRIFNNPFYAGWITHNGELHKGNHYDDRIISLDDFDYGQTLLGKKGKPRNDVNGYAFTGLIKCGECGCSIVAKTNTKLVKSEGRVKTYIHYYCTRKSEKRPCTQSKYTSLESLEAEITTELAKYTILPEFRDLALQILNRNHKIEAKDRSTVYALQQGKRKQLQEQLDSLVDMRTRNLLDDEEYAAQRTRIKSEMLRVDEDLRGTETRAENWLELTEQAFDFTTYAHIRFKETKDLKVKRDILMTLGENLVLKDQKLTLQQSEWLTPIGEYYPALEAEYLRRVRTNKKATPKVKEEALMAVSERWRARRDSNPRHPA
jgi:site-specific DNA recombinase